MAVAAARRGARTLLISTDPAASLSDAFHLARSRARRGRVRRLDLGGRDLAVVELDAATALERWLSARRERLERIALRGTWLDEEDVAKLLRLSLPGIDELAALLEIARFGREGRFDTVVVDTAPTGHTLRMLAMPETLRALARVFDHMQAKHHVMVQALRGRWTPDAEDALVDALDREGADLGDLLRDPARVRLYWVSLPEPMAIEETADAVARLRDDGIPIRAIVMNRVTPPPPAPCGWCDARRAFEARAIATVAGRIPGVDLLAVAARDREPRDVRAFSAIGKELETPAVFPGPPRAGRLRTWRSTASGRDAAPGRLTAGTQALLMFGGKGGTGKTTCAAATAIDLASREPGRRVLLLSVDPAHSLADVLGVDLGDDPRRVRGGPPNLLVRELDAARAFADVRRRYATAIDALFDRLSRGAGAIDVTADRTVMHDLIDLAPPGVDELAAVIDVLDALEDRQAGARDLVVLDTAPTGHALRLLETPALVQEWTRALMSILLKYQPVVGVGDLGAVLLKLSQGLGRMRALLVDSSRCRFLVVTRAAALPREETVRLAGRLRAMGIDVPAVIVNAAGRGSCARCRVAAAAERREIAAIRRAMAAGPRDTAIVSAPAEVPPPHGLASLRRWGRTWRTENVPARAVGYHRRDEP
jgi:arsenite-transporting ATPase